MPLSASLHAVIAPPNPLPITIASKVSLIAPSRVALRVNLLWKFAPDPQRCRMVPDKDAHSWNKTG